MEFINRYVSGIIVVCVLAILLENILPETHQKKYINVTIGLLVMLVIIKPFTGIKEWNPVFVMPQTVIDDEDLSVNIKRQPVIEEFQKRLALKLSQTVESRCQKQTNISVTVSTNENGEITGIEKITVYPLDEEILNIIAENSGVTADRIEEGR